MKQTPLKRTSPDRAKRRKVAAESHADCHGITPAELWRYLPQTADEWRALKVKRVDGAYVKERFECMVKHWGCWLCPSFEKPDIHHLVATGRSDELTNLFLVCRACHMEIQSSRELLPKVLLAKWHHDRATVSWVRLCHLAGRRIVPESFTE